MQQLLGVLAGLKSLLPFIIAFNLLLQGLHSALEMIKNLTASNLDNALSGYLGKFLGFLQSVIDLLVGNKEH